MWYRTGLRCSAARQNTELCGDDHAPVTRGRMRAQYPLPHAPPPPLCGSVWCRMELQIELIESGTGSGLCWLFQNLTSWPVREQHPCQSNANFGSPRKPKRGGGVAGANAASRAPAQGRHRPAAARGLFALGFARFATPTAPRDEGQGRASTPPRGSETPGKGHGRACGEDT